LCLPAPGDDTVHALAAKLKTLVFKRFVSYDRADLNANDARPFSAMQTMVFDLARRSHADKQRVGEVFRELDVQNNVLALGLNSEVSTRAARVLHATVLGELGLSERPAPSPHHEIRPGIVLSELDTNPLKMLEEHPDKSGNRFDLGERPVTDWLAALGEALDLIDLALPGLAGEFPATLRRIVPVGFDEHAHLSASYREAPGLSYLSLHPNAVTMAEAIVHESQHSKLNLLSWFDPILENAYTEWSPSPVRPDMRPLMGVLLAAHAFVPVAWLHRGLAQSGYKLTTSPWFDRRRGEVLTSNESALNTLRQHAKPTPTGARVLAALETLHADLMPASQSAND